MLKIAVSWSNNSYTVDNLYECIFAVLIRSMWDKKHGVALHVVRTESKKQAWDNSVLIGFKNYMPSNYNSK